MEGADGPIQAGVWHRYNGKSLVWYPKDDSGKLPATRFPDLDELMALNQLIVDDGDTPWCIGIEFAAATGWAATDWTEEMMLRTTWFENYDKWVTSKYHLPHLK